MRILRFIVLLIMMSVMVLWANAQTNLDFYSIENQFNSSIYNPAFLSSQKIFSFSIFPLGGNSIGYNNQQVIRQLPLKIISGVSTDQDFKDLLKSLEIHPSIHQNIDITLLNVTYPSKFGVFNFRIREIENFSATFKGNISDFIFLEGIQSAVTNQVQNIPAQGVHYREYSLGYSKVTRNNRFAAGLRAKLYFGKAAFFSEISGNIISTQSGEYALTTQGLARLSFPISTTNGNGTIKDISSGFNRSNTIRYLMNAGNPGIGVDLGINYRINHNLTFSMSVIDLGKINWNSNLNSRSFKSKAEGYVFPKDSYVTSNDKGNLIITKTGNDSYLESVSKVPELLADSSAFSKPMPVSIFTGMKYQINPSLKISLVDRYVILKNMNYNSISMIANMVINTDLSVSSGYSIIGNSYKNIPFAVLLKRDFGQVYIGTDNLVAFILPSVSDFAGFSFGTCFYLFKNRNLSRNVSGNYPFYNSRKIKKSKKKGLVKNNYPEF